MDKVIRGTLVLGTTFAFAPGIKQMPGFPVAGAMMALASPILLWIWLKYSSCRSRPIHGILSKDGFAWIDTVHPDFLDVLPEVGSEDL